MRRTILVCIACALGSVLPLRAAGPPHTSARLSPRQVELLKEAGRHWKTAREAARDGRYDQAVAPGRVAVNNIRLIAGDHPHPVGMLDLLAFWCERAERFTAAIQAREEALAVLKRLYGSDDWRVT